jgi:hypothetical protein
VCGAFLINMLNVRVTVLLNRPPLSGACYGTTTASAASLAAKHNHAGDYKTYSPYNPNLHDCQMAANGSQWQHMAAHGRRQQQVAANPVSAHTTSHLGGKQTSSPVAAP